jgi:hypothetical protein
MNPQRERMLCGARYRQTTDSNGIFGIAREGIVK